MRPHALSSSSATLWRAHATHLVVFQHGLWGNEKDFRNFQTLFQQYFPHDEVYAHIATSNATSLSSLFQTYDGIDVGGERLATEIMTLAEEMPKLVKFSIAGHSLGGLYARYCVGVLYNRGFFDKVEPMNFITLASPHMGIRRSQKTPMNAVFNSVMPNFFDITGQQFTLKDKATDATRALSRSLRKYPHCTRHSPYPVIDGELLVQTPEIEGFVRMEAKLDNGVLRLSQLTVSGQASAMQMEPKEPLIEAHSSEGEQAEREQKNGDGADHDASGQTQGPDEGDLCDGHLPRANITSAVEIPPLTIDLLDADVTVVLPNNDDEKPSKRNTPGSKVDEDDDWDIEIKTSSSPVSVDAVPSAECQAAATIFTIRLPRAQLVDKWKWICAISNASHGVCCRSRGSAEEQPETLLSCLTRGQFIQGLQLFRVRTLYSSIFNDLQVPYSCGSIRAFNPYRMEKDEASRSEFYRHIVMRSLWNAPLLRDTLPEDAKHRKDRESSASSSFSLVKMLSERQHSKRRHSHHHHHNHRHSNDNASFSFITSLTTQSSHSERSAQTLTSAPSSGSSSSFISASSASTMAHQDSQPMSSLSEVEAERQVHRASFASSSSSSFSSSSSHSRELRRLPPFEDGLLLLDHADLAFCNDELRDSLRGMMLSLQSVGWRRIDVFFRSPMAHVKIVAMQANPGKPLTNGLDVIHHVMDTFLL